MNTPEKNYNIYCRPKIPSSCTFFVVKVDGSDVIPGICLWLQGVLIYKHTINLSISVQFRQIVPIRFRNKWYIFSISITACFHNNTDFWVDVTSVNFNSKKVREDKLFGRQDILQFFSGVYIQRLQFTKHSSECLI